MLFLLEKDIGRRDSRLAKIPSVDRKPFEIIERDNSRVKKLHGHVRTIREGLRKLGFDAQELSEAMGLESQLNPTESSAKEIDTDDYNMSHQCPKCGFAFED